MADSMTKMAKDKAVKDTVVVALEDVFASVGATRIDDYTFAFPVTVEGEDTFAKGAITAVQRKDTKTTKAFDLDVAVAKYENKIAERDAKIAEREAAKAIKSAKAAE